MFNRTPTKRPAIRVPIMLPTPPRIITTSISGRSTTSPEEGVTDTVKAKSPPAKPVVPAPIMNESSLIRPVLTPENSAASQSSDVALIALPQ
jgi:hypothetical protein